ncbi:MULTISPECIES: cation:proton antiporter [Actinomadura]|uniref:Cation:proton antiporter n=1 Tax=Actinomadura yumaensis TaxID=111807 RepID=A0ABW2CQQ0_9ACTN|nr:cation:proton antiporter [Actinomadura sp. J1-007]MWK36762.1 cation:proton antiporter [Actinomadura sp. J1-007]
MLAAPVPPIPAHSLLVFLLQVALLGLLALGLGLLATRFGLPAIVGELTAGVLLGPSVLAAVAPDLSGWLLPHDPAQMHLLDAVGQIGVLLLVGVTGTEMDFGLLRRRRATALWVSSSGLLIPLGLGIAAGLVLPASLRTDGSEHAVFALFLGVAMCVSAIPVIAKTLMDMNLLHRNVGQLTLAAGMVDDAFGWFMLSIVSAMATAGVTAGQISESLAYLLLVVAFALVLGRPLARAVLRPLASAGDGPPIAGAAVLMLLGAAATQAMGLEAVFGAFVVGIVIGNGRAVGLAKLAPLRTFVLAFLAPVFFATAGLRIDLGKLADPVVLGAALALLAIAVAGKFAGAYLGARLSRMNRWEALALGAGMNARGVIEVIVAMVGLRLGVLNTATYTIIVLIAIVTSVMAPPILRVAMRRIEHTAEEELRLNERLGTAQDAP